MRELPHEIKLTYIIAIIVMLLFVCFIVMIVFIYNKKQLIQQQENQIKESEFQNQLLQKELERQKAIQLERERISQDMHDDLGAGISAIKLQAEFLKYKIPQESYSEDLEAIINTSEDMNLAMREILWSLDSQNDTIDNFIEYSTLYIKRFLNKTTIDLQFNSSILETETNLSVKARRNLFLVTKEAVHNVFKHSQANHLFIEFQQTETSFTINIIDDGIGLSEKIQKGNGLTNMSARMENINGTFKIIPVQKGTRLLFTYPFQY
ncbi:two-component sensor histidine kinase [Flavobacterium endoglycinae]|uniref:Two-component sensor histidine kinase n=1 Tax=Flavobacterium endoglycinae TaxID=2816357 RepID=A0ABX7QAU2_9FLAO|nr:histidine kinase [Flavobacterium endoglycinae]QSW88057.1 two-component sensor histidine kinase [Flavobacterium endoglycinae]